MSLPPGLDADRSAVLDRVAGLLDESVPGRFGALLVGHSVVTVQRRGWASIQNGKLLALAAGEFDALLTADKGMDYQQNPATLPASIHVLHGRRPGCLLGPVLDF